MIHFDYADDLVLLTDAPTRAQFLLHNLEQAVGALTSTRMQIKQSSCFLNEKEPSPLKLVDKFAYLGSNISSTESDVSIRYLSYGNLIYPIK